jgi:hypothetical protein
VIDVESRIGGGELEAARLARPGVGRLGPAARSGHGMEIHIVHHRAVVVVLEANLDGGRASRDHFVKTYENACTSLSPSRAQKSAIIAPLIGRAVDAGQSRSFEPRDIIFIELGHPVIVVAIAMHKGKTQS